MAWTTYMPKVAPPIRASFSSKAVGCSLPIVDLNNMKQANAPDIPNTNLNIYIFSDEMQKNLQQEKR